MFVHSLPYDDPQMHEQTELSTISQEEFDRGIKPEKSSRMDRVFETIQFIIGFGWLRLIVLFLLTIIYLILEIPCMITCYNRKICDIIIPFGIWIARLYIRALLFCFGVYHIKINGEIDPNAKACVFNHQTIFDGPMIYVYRVFTVISMAEILKVPFFGRILVAANSLFIDRSKNSGASEGIKNLMLDDSKFVGLSPEGKTTKGLYLLKFHTGGFLTDKPIQPVAIRYKTYFTFGKSGFSWVAGGFKEFVWRCFSTTFGVAEINFLPTIHYDEMQDKTPEEKALVCELKIANFLGVKATNRSNREIYKKKVE